MVCATGRLLLAMFGNCMALSAVLSLQTRCRIGVLGINSLNLAIDGYSNSLVINNRLRSLIPFG